MSYAQMSQRGRECCIVEMNTTQAPYGKTTQASKPI